jgi:hypothetical protein
MEQERKYFANPSGGDGGQGRGNFDDASFAIGINEYVNKENCRTGSTDAGFTGTVESIGSTLLISNPEPSITFIELGAVEDAENDRILYFKKNIHGPWDRIECYDISTQSIFIVLYSSQVVGGLNFDKDFPIHSARVVDGLLYWTDNLNRQRKVNIDAGINLNQPGTYPDSETYTDPVNEEVISLLKRPPLYPLTVQKVTQPSINNFTKNGAFQFCARYYYKDGETSVLSVYSLIAPYNSVDETYNRIDLTMPFNEYVDQDVQRVDFVVRYGETLQFFVIKSWDRNNAVQDAEIDAHNAGTGALTYSFYNDKIGEALDAAYVVKPFDSVPILSETLDVARNRLFLGHNLIGYDTLTRTSLLAEFETTTSGATVTATWYNILYRIIPPTSTEIRYFLYITGDPIYEGYYEYPPRNGEGTLPAPGLQIDWSELIFIGTSHADVAAYYGTTVVATIYFGINGVGFTATIVNAPFGTTLEDQRCFKTDASYQIAIEFLDFGDRKNGALTSDIQVYKTPDREYSTIAFTTNLNWSLSNTYAIDEIPEWATHYSVLITKCLRTRYFLQSRVKNMTYVTKDADGLYVFNEDAFDEEQVGVGIDITLLNSYGMGYAFTEGDLIKIYKSADTVVYTLSIIAQDGNWIVCELQDLGTIGDTGTPYITALFEIFTPYQASVNEAFYEVAQTFEINNPGTISREYSTLVGSIRGDITILQRSTGAGDYFTENMSPNDKYYQNWYTDAGRPNFIDNIGQVLETNTIAYSNTFIAGSRVNGLSSFEALNEKTIPLECGPIQKLQVTSKVGNQQGIVMLCICTDQTASLYIEEVQQYGSNASTTLTVFADVIGTINVLRGNYGTVDPTSVCEYRGLVFWFDAPNGRWVQYGGNGLFAISDYKMVTFWKLFAKQYLSMSKADIEALGSRPFVYSVVDPSHNELLITIPKLLEIPPYGYLPDYPEVIYPFNIWDGQAKCIVYHLKAEPNFWGGSYPYTVDGFCTAQNKLFLFKNGQLYEGNQTDSQCNIFGVQYKPRVMCVSNMIPTKPKVYDNIAVESNIKPSFIYLYNNYPYQQASDIYDIDFREKEGVFYAAVYRNKLVPTADGFTTDGLLTAEKMRNVAMFIMLEFNVDSTPLELKFLFVGFAISKGNSVQ